MPSKEPKNSSGKSPYPDDVKDWLNVLQGDEDFDTLLDDFDSATDREEKGDQEKSKVVVYKPKELLKVYGVPDADY